VPFLDSNHSKVKSVHEAKAQFKIDFEDGSSATLCLADPGSSVAVRDKSVWERIAPWGGQYEEFERASRLKRTINKCGKPSNGCTPS
jgi:hypothetical protein